MNNITCKNLCEELGIDKDILFTYVYPVLLLSEISETTSGINIYTDSERFYNEFKPYAMQMKEGAKNYKDFLRYK